MKCLVRPIRLVLATATFMCCQSLVMAGTLEDYYIRMALNGTAAPFSDLADRQELRTKKGTVILYLIVGDVFHFIGETVQENENKKIVPIDAMIVSTNVGLDFSTNNPTIQRTLRNDLPKTVRDSITSSFQAKGPLSDYRDTVLVDTGNGFSPRFFCFVATDRPEGGTGGTGYDTPWITFELSDERIGSRVFNSLSNFSKSTTVVTPLIGASKVDLNSGFIPDKAKRIKMRQRMAKSLGGILHGVETFLLSERGQNSQVKEFTIVVWREDLKRIVPKAKLADKSFKNNRVPGGYLELRDRMKQKFETRASDIRRRLGGTNDK